MFNTEKSTIMQFKAVVEIVVIGLISRLLIVQCFFIGNSHDFGFGGMGMIGVSAQNRPLPQDRPSTESIRPSLRLIPDNTLFETTASTPTSSPPMAEEPSAQSKCNLMYKPHATDPHMFEVSSSPGQFEGEFQRCAFSLVWNQDTCVCDWPKVVVNVDPKCGEKRQHPDPRKPWLYQLLVHNTWIDYSCSPFIAGLWSNEKCTCLYGQDILDSKVDIQITDPVQKRVEKCVVISNITMDTAVKDNSGNHISIPKNARIKIVRVRGSVGRAAFIRRSSIELDTFTSNDLTDTVRFAFNFKVHHHSLNTKRQMTLLTNKCRSFKGHKVNPSIELKFKPSDQSFTVQIATRGKRVLERFTVRKDPQGWYKTIIYLQDGVASVIVNNKTVMVVQDMTGPLLERPCKLMLAGSPFNAREYFDGYLDEFLSIKQCKCDCKKGPTVQLIA